MKDMKIRIGTRGSKLALWQAAHVGGALKEKFPEVTVEEVRIKTTGDKILDVPLAKVGGKGLFVKEIEEALLGMKADIAVHSMKDVPVDLPEGLVIAAMLARAEVRDALVSRKGKSFGDLKKGARIGTSSLRRTCQIKALRPDLKVVALRGNVDTRLKKLDDGEFDAVILAAAGLSRLGLDGRVTELLPFDISLPAIGQGAIGIETREKDPAREKAEALGHADTLSCVSAERSFLRKLQGGCQVPIAAHAVIDGERLSLTGLVGEPDGSRILKDFEAGLVRHAEMIGIRLADKLIERGANAILARAYAANPATHDS
ncbi:MAG: hydroxymethylbilane synthase [Deltaproteobacteria bacterium]|nr:hydroxymethylbilane synthase [Deltaproteobacteria bacterium]